MADSFELKAIITGVNRLSPALTTMQKDLRKFKGEFKDVMKGVAVGGAALMAAFVLPVNQAIAFESAMADVRKVVNFETPQQFKEMSADVLDLSSQLPMAAEGIAQIYAAGGQSGIARNELRAFATDAIKMGVAFDQTAEESGQMMAQWRTSFKMSQDSVRGLADQINYLGNTGPASSKKISDIVTKIGPLGNVAGVSSGGIAALGATIAGMGIESDIAATGIKNFMLSLNSGRASGLQKKVYQALKIDPKKLAADMQKDSKTAMLGVLKSIGNLPKAKQASALEILFGRESIAAIAPLLTNLDLLTKNFDKVTDKQKYAGSMQQEYASRAATTANEIQLLKNQVSALGITVGDVLLPPLNEGIKQLKPFLSYVYKWAKANPELIKTTFKLGVYLSGVAIGVTAVGKAIQFMGFAMNMTPLGKLLTLVIGAGALIVANWDTVGPMFKDIWQQIKPLVDQIGEWKTGLSALAIYIGGSWLVSFIAGINAGGLAVVGLTAKLKGLFAFSGKVLAISVLISLFKQLNDLQKQAGDSGKSVGQLLVERKEKNEAERGYQGFIPRFKEVMGSLSDFFTPTSGVGQPGSLLNRPPMNGSTQKRLEGQMTVEFQNAPPGMKVNNMQTNIPGFGLGYDVGYSRFAKDWKGG